MTGETDERPNGRHANALQRRKTSILDHFVPCKTFLDFHRLEASFSWYFVISPQNAVFHVYFLKIELPESTAIFTRTPCARGTKYSAEGKRMSHSAHGAVL